MSLDDDFCDECCRTLRKCRCGDDIEIEKCMGCGGYYSEHAGLLNWSGGSAPQLCAKCWRDGGYPWPERYGE